MFFGWFKVACVICVWGVTFASTRILLVDFSAFEILVLRFALAYIALWVCCVVGRCARTSERGTPRGRPILCRDKCGWWLFATMGLTGIVAYQFLENCAIYYTNASNVAILVSFGPIVTALLARVLTRDQYLSAQMLVGSVIAVGGIVCVSLNGIVAFKLRPVGDLMALGAMVSWGFYSVLIDKANERGISPLVAIRKAFGWSLVLMLPFVAWGATESGYCAMDGSFSVTLDAATNMVRFAQPLAWLNIVFLGVCASALCFVLWSSACHALGVVRTTVTLYLTPIVGVAFAVIFLGERLTFLSIIGGMVILGGVAVATFNRRVKT